MRTIDVSKGNMRRYHELTRSSLLFKMQYIVQEMLHSDTGVPIRSHRSKLLATVPSAFTG